jgi:hypothetical protein
MSDNRSDGDRCNKKGHKTRELSQQVWLTRLNVLLPLTGYDMIVDIYLIKNKISFSCNVVWIKWVMGHQYLLESNCCCLWKHVENNFISVEFYENQ